MDEKAEIIRICNVLHERAAQRGGEAEKELSNHFLNAYETGDLERLRIYEKIDTPSVSIAMINACIRILKRMGYTNVCGTLTNRNVEAYAALHEAIREASNSINPSPRYVLWELLLDDITNDSYLIHLVRDLKITDEEELKTELFKARNYPAPLLDGRL